MSDKPNAEHVQYLMLRHRSKNPLAKLAQSGGIRVSIEHHPKRVAVLADDPRFEVVPRAKPRSYTRKAKATRRSIAEQNAYG